MKTLFKSLAVAAMVLAPAVASAQPVGSVAFTLASRPFAVLEGGGFGTSNVVFTPTDGAPINLANFLVWCIDETRGVSVGSSYTYDMYTVGAFANTNFGGGVYNASLADMRRITSLTETFQNASANPVDWTNLANKDGIQNGIWDTFEGLGSALGNPGFVSADWFILHNGQSQTFAVRLPSPNIVVPEPSTYAMMAMGLVGLAGFARRRRNNA